VSAIDQAIQTGSAESRIKDARIRELEEEITILKRNAYHLSAALRNIRHRRSFNCAEVDSILAGFGSGSRPQSKVRSQLQEASGAQGELAGG
jgi:hypothetical protein